MRVAGTKGSGQGIAGEKVMLGGIGSMIDEVWALTWMDVSGKWKVGIRNVR